MALIAATRLRERGPGIDDQTCHDRSMPFNDPTAGRS
jgi:hypothetical protein